MNLVKKKDNFFLCNKENRIETDFAHSECLVFLPLCQIIGIIFFIIFKRV